MKQVRYKAYLQCTHVNIYTAQICLQVLDERQQQIDEQLDRIRQEQV